MILPKAPKKKKIMISNINQIKCRSKAESGQPCCMLRSITYKVVNDANDALNVFVEMVSIKLALQSLRENRKKIVYMILITKIIIVIIMIIIIVIISMNF